MKGKELDDYAKIEDDEIRKYITALKARSDGDVEKVMPGLCNAIAELMLEHARAVAAFSNKDFNLALSMSLNTFNIMLVQHSDELHKAFGK